ncbi:MAG: InlB B-repeat-containing protein, partial [Aquificaceae bacterium]
YVMGDTYSTDFPTQNAYDSSYNGNGDVFVTKLSGTAPPSTYTLTVTKQGTGSGTVTSSPAGINCGSDCSEAYNSGTVVTLTATPATGSTFGGWSGACSSCGNNTTCQITMDANKTCTATFNTSTGGGDGGTGGGGTGGGGGGGGCSMVASASPVNALLWLLLPAYILVRRYRRA